ncbi:uncharacterized protein RAG0_14971 [Rhynchosporium agropyri]|uniref:Uncharacterized protein n=2 Tax=Rhynchosporium TaxID=38037 RepID=A0A1E1MH98_RHYSE|nr:uncharacterized protein RAG0_14971 [Rhynchosporium agropyri]CZT48482.1 uncharacterized protein RSE6_09179 [Rhynchosporium secalis]
MDKSLRKVNYKYVRTPESLTTCKDCIHSSIG